MHKETAKRVISLLLCVVICLGPVLPVTVDAGTTDTAKVTYRYDGQYIYNWGTRGEVATYLSPMAEDFYEENNITYAELADLSGSANVNTVPSSALYKSLKALMERNHDHKTNYQETRYQYMYTDCQQNGYWRNGQISSFYSGSPVGPAWDSGSTWNREHTWPNSKGDASGQGENDIMMLRPTATSENGSRGNKAYGESSGFYFPNRESNGTFDVRGDVARIMLFVYCRWGNTGSMWGSSGVMENREVLLKWVEADPVDTWELGRNDSTEAITGTRNVFVDYPELIFIMFGKEIPANMPTPSGYAIAQSCTHPNAEVTGSQAATCTTAGYKTYYCATCRQTYTEQVKQLGHSWGQWAVVTESMPGVNGEKRRDCSRCGHFETNPIPYQDRFLLLSGADFAQQNTVWINGLPCSVVSAGEGRYVEVPVEGTSYMTTYTFHVGDAKDVHTQYPTGMKVYKITKGASGYTAKHIPELDNLLQYSGSSIRITGKKGIRMITSLNKATKTALTGKGLAGYKLEEYGTVLAFASEIKADGDLVLGKSYSRSNYAYKKGVADPVFADTGKLVQYTNVLVGFNLDQCKQDIAMRPYIILSDGSGNKITLYGGTIYRSIGYIAYQNRNVFKPGNGSYDYVWEIIHHVYGNKYDKDFKG